MAQYAGQRYEDLSMINARGVLKLAGTRAQTCTLLGILVICD